MIFKGIRFGMLLQLAVGPMCLMVLNTSAAYGFIEGLILALAIAVIDALYIGLSCTGAAAVINKPRIKIIIKVVGCLVLVIFGMNTISGAFDLPFIPKIAMFSAVSSQNIFLQGLILTASNPLTIIFWSSMFSSQMIENKWNKKELILFAAGCVVSTILFMSFVALLGSMLGSFLPDLLARILNAIVGLFLIFFGLKLLLSKDKNQTKPE